MKAITQKLHIPHWLIIILIVAFVLRIPSFFEPYSYGDEMIYLTLGRGIREGIPLYSGLHDNKPPLLYIIAAIAGNLFWFKAILAGWMLATTVLFWKFCKSLFPKEEKLQKIAVGIFALLTTIPLLEGNTANAELFMIGPIIYAFWLLLSQKNTPKNLFKAGLAFSVAALFKLPAAFDIGAVFAFWLIIKGIKKNNLVTSFKNFGFILLGFSLPILATIIWYALRGALPEYITAAFLQNLGYLSSWRGEKQASFLTRNIPLFIRSGILLAGLGLVYWKRHRLSKEFIFLACWMGFSLFAVTLSERPYPHYLIQSIAPISFFMAILFSKKDLTQTLAIIPLAVAFFVPLYYKYWLYPTFPYYTNFIKFSVGNLDKDAYFASFNKNAPKNYKVSDFVLNVTKPKEKVFVWGDSATIYALTRRLPPIKYTADYHIKDFSSREEVFTQIEKNPPKVIVILPGSESFPQLARLLKDKYILLTIIDGVEIWKELSPKAQSAIISSSF